jgi:hypothetical protein
MKKYNWKKIPKLASSYFKSMKCSWKEAMKEAWRIAKKGMEALANPFFMKMHKERVRKYGGAVSLAEISESRRVLIYLGLENY